ncbi:DNA repair protein Nse1 [Aspergillus japonicus CBS 114.51]|uniref:Non-structural maintenance of chromosomes element 1 homolog n=1 Tax=Aspergillus japonicus CBS 114.51 TaxID=1448312 RepID=A0A8T8WSS5_ASPJA|nr:DNA repair protein Nse1 [Aspergillus japonicus CBS 114.51]RAH78592.1 DNA repair protein Nse1 [Aspergillus japonicus CBS 114.51]
MVRETGPYNYNDTNRAFLQAFMGRSTMTFEEAKPVLAAIFSAHEKQPVSPEEITEDELQSYIVTANNAISPFDLEIRSTLPQIEVDPSQTTAVPPPERVYALVNTTSDALTQLATTYSADEIAYVKRLLDAMFETHNTRRCEAMAVSGMQALQLAKVSGDGGSQRRESGLQSQPTLTQGATQQPDSQVVGGVVQSLTMSQAEALLKQLVEEGWFGKSPKGFYSLSPRGLIELRGWLVATYNDEAEGIRKIKFCAACKDLITAGQRCGDRDCLGRLHDHCMRHFFRSQQAEVCPVCKDTWPGDKFVGERAVTQADQELHARRRRSSNTQRPSDAAEPSTQLELAPVEEDEGSD